MTPHALDHLLAVLIAVALPVSSFYRFRDVMRTVATGEPPTRRRWYVRTMVTQWSLVAILALVWWWYERPMRLAFPWGPKSALGLTITAVIFAVLLLQRRALRAMEGPQLAAARAQLESVRQLMPHTHGERRWFTAVAITAGVCEELLFRGFLIGYFASAMLPWIAMILVAAIFGMGHAYQGRAGILKTAVVGALMGVIYLVCGSLVWPIILHALIDMQAGFVSQRLFSHS